MISPVVMISLAVVGDSCSTKRTVLSTTNNDCLYCSSLARWWACTASSTASSCRPKVQATAAMSSVDGSCRPTQTNPRPECRTACSATYGSLQPGTRTPST